MPRVAMPHSVVANAWGSAEASLWKVACRQ
jgi:hypothetical protein